MVVDKRTLRRLASKEMHEGLTYESNHCGLFKIVDYTNNSEVKVRFLETGYETTTHLSHIKRGFVKDPLYPRLYGVGYLGIGTFLPSEGGKDTKVYYTWRGMLQRCYCDKAHEAHPTYKGCTVAEEWHNFQNFAKWFEENYIEGYHLDKDIKVEGNKVYGPSTCMFVSHSTNMQKAHAKNYTLVPPEGGLVAIYNMADFCRENNLCRTLMYNVVNGKAKQHKGWRKYDEQLEEIAAKVRSLNYAEGNT